MARLAIKEHWVKQTWFFDVQASYEIRNAYRQAASAICVHNGWPTWRYLLDQTTITLGVNNIFDHDPPHSVSFDNFPRAIYDPTGRFIYASLKKIF